MSKNGISHVNDGDFEKTVLESSKPVFVDFYAEWCGPCKIVNPTVEELAEEYGDRVAFYKVDVDENAQAPQKYSVMGVPTLMIFEDGEVVSRIVGAKPKSKLESEIREVIA